MHSFCLYLIKFELNTPLWGPWGLISLFKHCPEARYCQDVTKWKFVMYAGQWYNLPTNNTHAYPCCYSQQQLLAEAYDDSTGLSECRLVDCDRLSLCIVCNDLNWKFWNLLNNLVGPKRQYKWGKFIAQSESPTYKLQQQFGLGPRLLMDVAVS